ncbi:MAG: CrcB family protein [Caulobacteraceae bacterium]|nr:CrcB family protein [Caulobacteraceae bacterium]
MLRLILVFAGGGLGSLARYGAGVAAMRLSGPGWWGTLFVNIVGGLLMGLLVGTLAHRGGAQSETWRVFLAVGVLGGFTTFSAFSLDAARMIETRAYGPALAYVAVSVMVSIAMVFVGMMLARRIFA